jgi:negative regulator of flagellin synthesis FlgM
MAMEIKNLLGEVNPYGKKKVNGNTRNATDAASRTSNAEGKSDTIAFSSEAKLRSTALQTANEASDIRRQKVNELKEQVRNNSYQPDIKKAAANLIRDDLELLV